MLAGAAVVCGCALSGKRYSVALCAAAALGALAALFALPSARSGAMLLANRLFASSEAANAYAYERFAAAEEPAALRLALLCLAVLLGALCTLARRRGAVAAVFLGVVFAEAYFGVTPGIWRNLLLFAVLALLLAPEGIGSRAAVLALFAFVAAAVLLIAPRPIDAVEAYSEHVRDELAAAAVGITQETAAQNVESERAHQESRRHEEGTSADEAREAELSEYAHLTENEHELSLPKRVDYLRIALWLLLAAALLTVPFLPFLFFDRARRRTEARRLAFADSDNSAAIRAMFAHAVEWLTKNGLQTENRPFALCTEAVGELTSGEYAERYAESALIWEEAAYSSHAMTDAQRETVRALLDTTAKLLYERADRRTRFRMKYVYCLCGS